MVSTRSGGAKPTPKRAAEKPAAGESAAKKPATPKPVFEVGKPVVKDVTLVNQDDAPVTFSDLYKDSGVVIFMYPKANTPGCTKQACGAYPLCIH
jgi:thioredoxin-dependent peroxiredoxin